MPERSLDVCAELLAVLKPFAAFNTEDWPDTMRLFDGDPTLTMGHMRAVRDLHARLAASGPNPMQPSLNAKVPVSRRGGSGFNAGGANGEADAGRTKVASHLPLSIAEQTPSSIVTADGRRFSISWKATRLDNPYGPAEAFAAYIVAACNSFSSRAPAGPDPDTQGGALPDFVAAADYYTQLLRNVIDRKVVRDLAEAEAWFSSARARVAPSTDPEGKRP